MDILIPLGLGSAWQNNELRYCLRSIARYATDASGAPTFDRLFVVGDDPGFLSRDVEFHAVKDLELNKEARIACKILWAFQHTDISDQVVLFNDDYVLTRHVDLGGLLPCHRGSLKTAWERQENESYKRALGDTIDALEAAGKPTLHYDIHVPIQVRRHAFEDLIDWWRKSAALPQGLVVKSTYANNALMFPGVPMRDCKFRQAYTEDELELCMADRFVFSYGDAGLTPVLKQWLTDKFPYRSKWEQGSEVNQENRKTGNSENAFSGAKGSCVPY